MTHITLTLAVLLTLYLLWEWYTSHRCPICGKKGKYIEGWDRWYCKDDKHGKI